MDSQILDIGQLILNVLVSDNHTDPFCLTKTWVSNGEYISSMKQLFQVMWIPRGGAAAIYDSS